MCFETERVIALQGHPRSLILAQMDSAYATSYWSYCRAVKISAAAAADNFGWLGGAPSVFRRRRRRMIPAGGGGAIRRLRGLANGVRGHPDSTTHRTLRKM